MSVSESELQEHKYLRDVAKGLIREDIEHLKGDVAAKGVASRFASRMSEGAGDVFDEAVSAADSHRGVLGTLIAAVFIWFARTPVSALFADSAEGDFGTDEDGDDNPTADGIQPENVGEAP